MTNLANQAFFNKWLSFIENIVCNQSANKSSVTKLALMAKTIGLGAPKMTLAMFNKYFNQQIDWATLKQYLTNRYLKQQTTRAWKGNILAIYLDQGDFQKLLTTIINNRFEKENRRWYYLPITSNGIEVRACFKINKNCLYRYGNIGLIILKQFHFLEHPDWQWQTLWNKLDFNQDLGFELLKKTIYQNWVKGLKKLYSIVEVASIDFNLFVRAGFEPDLDQQLKLNNVHHNVNKGK